MANAAFITGSSKRIGKSIALELAAQGYDIGLHYNSSIDSIDETRNEVKKAGVKCNCYDCDFTDENQLFELMPKVVKDFSNLNILVNNASIFVRNTLMGTDIELFNKTFAINLKAPFILTHDFADLVNNGQIINIIDTKISQNNFNYFAYTLSKKALADMTLMSAKELGPKIRVNGICPGLILPPEGKDNEYLNNLAKEIPLKRKGEVEFITNAINYLINNEYITGQLLYIDGGQHLI